MANSDYERRTAQDYTDQHVDRSNRYDANSWGMIVGIAAVVGIIALLFIGLGSSGPDTQTQPTAVEKTAPTTTAPTTQPAPAPTPPATAPN
jgi:hypothetical protein